VRHRDTVRELLHRFEFPNRKMAVLERNNSLSRSFINAASILKQKPALRKKSLTFAPTIERVCHFVKSTPADVISRLDVVYIQDTGDVDLCSVSSALLIPDRWVITYRSCPTFDSHPVVLDSVYLRNDSLLCLSILVQNLDFEKHVTVRYTLNGWKTYRDVDATFESVLAPQRTDYPGVDRFVHAIDLNKVLNQQLHSDVDFCIKYQVRNQTYWDNNGQLNYKVF
jgi:hypothetical protein